MIVEYQYRHTIDLEKKMLRPILALAMIVFFMIGACLPDSIAQTGKENDFVMVASFGRSGRGDGAFGKPYGPTSIAVSPNGELVVVDTSNNRIQIFNRKGQYLRQFGKYGRAEGMFDTPASVAIFPSGNIIVADAGNHRVQIFDGDGKFLRQFGKEGRQEGEFDTAVALALTPANEIVVVDCFACRVQIFDANGKFLRQFGTEGDEEGEFSNPRGVAVSPSGHIVIADTDNYRVQVFDTNGKFLRQFGKEGTRDGQFGASVYIPLPPDPSKDPNLIVDGCVRYSRGPYAVAVMPSGEVVVSDTGNYCLQMFTATGQFLKRFGQQRRGKGLLSGSIRPIACLDADSFVVADNSTNHIQIYVRKSKQLSQNPPDKKQRQRQLNEELRKAIVDGSESDMVSAIRRGANVNYVDNDGNTPLIYACYVENYAAVNCLISHKVNVNYMNHHNETCALDFARFNAQITELLVRSGAKKLFHRPGFGG